MTNIPITTDISKFKLQTLYSDQIALDLETDLIKPTFDVPLNLPQNSLREFLTKYNGILEEANLVQPSGVDITQTVVWNDLLFLQHDLKHLWTKPALTSQKKKDFKASIIAYSQFLKSIDELEDSAKIQLRFDGHIAYELPIMNNNKELLNSIAELMLSHFKWNAPSFGELTFRKEVIDKPYIHRLAKNREKLPNELTPPQVTATIVRELLIYLRANNLIASKATTLATMSDKEGRFIHQFVSLFGLDTMVHRINLHLPSNYTAFSNTLRSNLRKLYNLDVRP